MNALAVCQSCCATAEGCQLKHFGGRECCTDCRHVEQEEST